MTAEALLLVTASGLMHALWNFLTKDSADKLVFLWGSGIVGCVLFLPALLWADGGAAWPARVWLGFGIGAVIRAAYFLSLGAAYSRGDLSLVYPLARGIAPVLVPVGAAVVLGERLSITGALGVALVALGVYVLHLRGRGILALVAPLAQLRAGAARYAAVTGVLTTTYSLVDKWNISDGAPPIPYVYFTIPGAALLLTPVALRRPARARAGWLVKNWRVPAVALLMTSGYLLVLLALQSTQVSRVAPARELGIVFGAILGSVILREGAAPQRIAGASVIVLGVALLSVSA
jgi:drug/metabolite transporter (DMT)-like permease